MTDPFTLITEVPTDLLLKIKLSTPISVNSRRTGKDKLKTN